MLSRDVVRLALSPLLIPATLIVTACAGGNPPPSDTPNPSEAAVASASFNDQDARRAMGTPHPLNPYHHERYDAREAVAAMGELADDNPLHHERYTDDEARLAVTDMVAAAYTDGDAVSAMGTADDANPLNHHRFTSSDAVAGMGARDNANPLHHDRYDKLEAQAAMGSLDDRNSLNHTRFTDAEAVAAVTGAGVPWSSIDDKPVRIFKSSFIRDEGGEICSFDLPDGRAALIWNGPASRVELATDGEVRYYGFCNGAYANGRVSYNCAFQPSAPFDGHLQLTFGYADITAGATLCTASVASTPYVGGSTLTRGVQARCSCGSTPAPKPGPWTDPADPISPDDPIIRNPGDTNTTIDTNTNIGTATTNTIDTTNTGTIGG